MDFLYSLSLAFEDLKNPAVKKISVFNGFVWGIVWLFGGFFLYDSLKSFSVFIINILPFKFLQHAGADFIIMILWLQAVLITLGVIVSLFSEIISKKTFTILLSVVISFLWFLFFFENYNSIVVFLQKILRIFPFETVEEAVASVMSVFILYTLYIATMYLSFLFLISSVISKMRETQYLEMEKVKKSSLFKLFFVILRDLIIFMLFFLIFYPLLFIPFINVILIVLMWSLLIKESLSEFIYILLKRKIDKKILWVFAFISVIFNFIPVVNFFAPAIGVLCIYHYVFEKETDDLKKDV